MARVATRVSSPLFIGRQAELQTLTDALDRAADGVASTVLIGGDAGIGKIRLVAEVAGRAPPPTGVLVLEGGCVSLGDGGGLPFAPIVEALRRLAGDPCRAIRAAASARIEDLRSPATAELGRLIPELGSCRRRRAGDFDRPEWVQARIFEGLLALLRALGERAPVAADPRGPPLGRWLHPGRHLVPGAERPDRATGGHRHVSHGRAQPPPSAPAVAVGDGAPAAGRSAIELARFGRAELEAQVAAILDHAPAAGLVETVERRTEGNPFFVEELLASGADEPGHGLPQTLRDVLLTRVTALPDPAQRLLGVAAVAGRSVDSELLATVAGLPEAELEASAP